MKWYSSILQGKFVLLWLRKSKYISRKLHYDYSTQNKHCRFHIVAYKISKKQNSYLTVHEYILDRRIYNPNLLESFHIIIYEGGWNRNIIICSARIEWFRPSYHFQLFEVVKIVKNDWLVSLGAFNYITA